MFKALEVYCNNGANKVTYDIKEYYRTFRFQPTNMQAKYLYRRDVHNVEEHS